MPEDNARTNPRDRVPPTREELTQHILENLSEKIVDQLRRVQPEDVSFLNQDYGDTAELVLTAVLHKEDIEDLYEVDAAELWNGR
jgi:hypothetical protein